MTHLFSLVDLAIKVSRFPSWTEIPCNAVGCDAKVCLARAGASVLNWRCCVIAVLAEVPAKASRSKTEKTRSINMKRLVFLHLAEYLMKSNAAHVKQDTVTNQPSFSLLFAIVPSNIREMSLI
jgi:hypothetical protein